LLQELLNREADILRDLTQQQWRDVSTGVKRNRRPPTIRVPVLLVRSTLANLTKPEPFKNPRNFARL
jgi:hypothetical protein